MQLEFIRFNKIGYIHKHLSSNLIRFLLNLFWKQLSSFWYKKVQKVSPTPTRFKMLVFTRQLPNDILSLAFWLLYTIYNFYNYFGHFQLTIKARCSHVLQSAHQKCCLVTFLQSVGQRHCDFLQVTSRNTIYKLPLSFSLSLSLIFRVYFSVVIVDSLWGFLFSLQCFLCLSFFSFYSILFLAFCLTFCLNSLLCFCLSVKPQCELCLQALYT